MGNIRIFLTDDYIAIYIRYLIIQNFKVGIWLYTSVQKICKIVFLITRFKSALWLSSSLTLGNGNEVYLVLSLVFCIIHLFLNYSFSTVIAFFRNVSEFCRFAWDLLQVRCQFTCKYFCSWSEKRYSPFLRSVLAKSVCLFMNLWKLHGWWGVVDLPAVYRVPLTSLEVVEPVSDMRRLQSWLFFNTKTVLFSTVSCWCCWTLLNETYVRDK